MTAVLSKNTKKVKFNFICVGASKSGTTALHDILSEHNEIYLPSIKETQFFVKEEQYAKGLRHYFATYFKDPGRSMVCGEVCPQYMSCNLVPQRIFRDLGSEVKIIMMVRNPIDRLYSHFNMKTRSYEDEDINVIIQRLIDKDSRLKLEESLVQHQLEYNRFKKKMSPEELDAFRYTRYLYPGRYGHIYTQYASLFGDENIYVCLYDDLLLDPKAEITKILEFIGVSSDVALNFTKRSNAAKVYKSRISKTVRSLIARSVNSVPGIQRFKNKHAYLRLRGKIDRFLTDTIPNNKISDECLRRLIEYYREDMRIFRSLIQKDLRWKGFEEK